ncbi:MAG: hypothetical protein ABSF60_09565 [Verrucomicrobiota bacterium]
MKKIPIILLLVALSTFAQTNEPVMAVLPAGGQFYTNAQITRVTPAYAVVIYDGGSVQLALSNLPASCQEKYGYDPVKAARFLADEKQRVQAERAALMARQAAYNRAVASLVGTNRPVQIISISDDLSNGGIARCAVQGASDDILVKNLPDAVRSFLNRKRQLAADINSFNDKVQADASAAARAQAVVPAYASTDPDTLDAQNNQRAQANLMALNVKEEQAVLARMNNAMRDLDAETADRTTIMAFPTGEFFGGFEIWNCVGMP